MLLQIAKLGNPILRKLSEPVTPDELLDPATQRLIDDMIETMRDADGIGLAAPQVFVSRRIQVLEIRANPRYPTAPSFPLMVLANPEIEPLTDQLIEAWEGCLSVDNLRGKVRRPAAVAVRYLDRYGEAREFEFEGFPAVVVQHETDHLFGKLFLDRMSDMSTLTQMREWERYWLTEQVMVAD
ncbi:MAG: peptide deformylase [Candidatus Sericytochromatia bacterium]|nr:peptide deformylase [Candidatus Tanganyikabacteria bacterium]